jgi:light-regulated signal transduction histidine kinase (bacteriophytochrome)
MQLSSDELFEANAKLRQEAESLKAVNEDLKSVLFSMNLAAEDLSDDFNPAEYIKKQSEEIVKISRQREELLTNLEKQNQELNDYAHMVSHDLKSPLRTINTLVAWIVEDSNGKLDAETQNSLGLIQYNVEKMDLLIKGILNYSSVDRQDAENRIIDFNQLLDETVQTMMVPNHIKVSIKKEMPKLEGNYYRFRQLFQNIIENAVKYNDKQDGLIEVGCDEAEKEYVFFVKDNGRGTCA